MTVLSEDAAKVVASIKENCELLWNGYSEKVEYSVNVAYHNEGCKHFKKSSLPKPDCKCPTIAEKRSRVIKRPGYLDQLKDYAANKDTDRNPKAERGAPRVKTAGKPPGDMGGFFALDELMCEIPRTVEDVLEEAGRDPGWALMPAKSILMNLDRQVVYFANDRLDLARRLDSATRRWVATARSVLKVTVSSSIFEGVVCGNCGGGLTAPWDAASGGGDVRCAGSPDAPPCGETYPMSEWMSLYKGPR